MNEINLKLETKQVQSKSIKTRFTITYGDSVFGMSNGALKWFLNRYKTKNMVNRLKNRSL
jgi:hypothetical protein